MVTKADLEAACWPTEPLEHVLKAVLLKDQRAYTEWKRWSVHVNFFEDALHGGSYQLLPLIYKNFQTLDIEDPLTGRLKGIVRNTWTRNQLFVQQVVPVMLALDNAGIQTLLLHHTALMLAIYADYGVCLLDTFDIYISPRDLLRSRNLISRTGVWSTRSTPKKHKKGSANHLTKITFLNKQGNWLRLHFYLPLRRSCGDEKADLWDKAVAFKFQNINTYTLCPPDQVLALLLDGLLINRVLSVDWIAHIASIINGAEPEMDWQRLISAAREHHLVLAVRNTLHYLAKELEVAIPTTQLDILDNLSVSKFEEREWRAITCARSGLGFRYQRSYRLWYGFMRMRGISGWGRLNPAYIYAFYKFIRQ